MNGILFLFLVIMLLVILGLMIYVLYEYVHHKVENDYDKLLKKSTNIKVLKGYEKCPTGCNKGVCVNKDYCSITDMLSSKCCGFDIQCHHCVDLDGEYYKYPNNYYEHQKQEINLKNDKIKLKNKRIDEINRVIKKINNKL